AKEVLGSYDPDAGILTVVRYDKPADAVDYVNSKWEMQTEPYRGDVINSYNDGPPAPGAAPLGPFYELETSSPARALKPGERVTHTQVTFHFSGSAEAMDVLVKKLFGVDLASITNAFR
ncbi:MAG TPA: DUF6786 family protein, partial [Chryseosolibacter sp.]|nr:DUF6786 family protein [Chryseosolibacter sp.]